MKTSKILATVALSTLLLTGCSFNNGAIVKVSGNDITQAQFNKNFEKATNNPMFKQMGVNLKSDPNNFLYLMIKDRVVNELIVKELIAEEMAKKNIKVTKDEVNQ